ncbi:MAG: PAS domain S-box protein [Terriglobales bacterium]
MVAAFGITASAVMFWVVEHLERSRAEAYFHQVAEQRLSVVRTNVADALDTISLLASHFEATGEAGTSRQAFSTLVAPALAKHRYIQALEWIPRVEGTARPEYERLAQADGIYGFRFTEAQGVGFLAVAEPRDEYFPVFYVEPLAGNEKALGYNLACNPARLAALQEARDSGRITATARVKLVQEKGDQYGFLVFAPVYSRSQPDVLNRQKALKGFALGVFRIGDFITSDEGLRLGKPDASPLVVIHVFDPAAPESSRQLHPSTPETTAERVTRGLHAEEEFEVGGRTWLLVATPGPGFRDLPSSANAWVVLLFGFLVTGVYVLYLRQRIRHFAQITKSARKLEIAKQRLTEAHRIAQLGSIEHVLGTTLWRVGEDARAMLDLAVTESTGELPVILRNVHCDDRPHLITVLTACELDPVETGVDIEFRAGSPHQQRVIHALGKPVASVKTRGGLQMLVTLQDITGRRQAEEALRESEERFQQISHNIDQVFYLAGVVSGRIAYVSPAFEKMFGRSWRMSSQAPGLWLEAVIPECREQIVAGQKRLLAGEPVQDEYQIVGPDGSPRWIKHHASPIRDAQGKVSKYAGVLEDITEAHAAREALRQSEEKYRSLVRNIPDVVWSVDSQRRVAFVSPNSERLLGYSAEDFCRQGAGIWFESIHPDDAGKVSDAFEALFAKGEPYDVECRVRRKDGKWIWAHDRAIGTYERDGIRYADGVVSDITERKQAEQKLRESEDKLRLLLDSAAEAIFGVDLQGRCTFCNPACLRQLGYKHSDELLGKNMHELIHHSHRDGTPFAVVDCLMFQALEKGQGIHLDDEEFWKADGTSFPVEYWSYPQRKGQIVVGAVVAFLDITERKRADQKLRESEDRLRLLLESAAEAIFGIDLQGRCTFCNPAGLRLLGYEHSDELLGKNMHALSHHSHRDGTPFAVEDCPIHQALEIGQGAHVDEEVLWKADGTSFPAEYWSYPQRKGQKIVGAVVALIDVTERKRAEEELRSKTAFLEAQVNSTGDGILVVNGEGQKILQNQRFIDMLKIPQHLVEGKVDKAELEYVAGKIKNPAEFLEKVAYLYNHPSETSRDEIELKDGTILDRYSSPVVGKERKYYGRIWTFRDITERRRNEDVLAVEQSPASIMITDPEGTITYVNPKFSERTGYRRGEVIGQNPRILKSGHSSPDEYRKLWQTITGGGEWRGEFHNKKKNGELYWESVAITPIKDAKGAISHFLAIKEDITEHKAMESQLRQAQKLEAIGQLAAGIAHEINTPTQFASDNLTFLRDSWKSLSAVLEVYRSAIADARESGLSEQSWSPIREAERKEDLEFIASEIPRAIEQALDGVQRVAKIVRAMKEFSHPDSGEKALVDINKAIETTITVARNEWKYVAEMGTRFDTTLALVPCHVGELNQVILNLIVNAAHAIKSKVQEGQKGRIAVVTSAKGSFAEIAIRDTGTGIPEAIRSRVFDPFFTTKEVGKGTGQGLALAHSIVVKKHGGKIWFETEAGRGTTFFIQLPLHATGQEQEP